MNKRTLYAVMAGGAGMGLVASFLQMLEKLTLLGNSHAVLACNINSVFSCSNVLNAWQSSVFGFPNALLSIVFFAVVLGVGLVGLSGGTVTRPLRLTMQGLSLFFLIFGLWFLQQSTFRVGSLCIFCSFNFAGLVVVNFAWLRLNAPDLPIPQRCYKRLQRGIASGADIFGWILLVLIVAFTMALHLR